MGVRLTVSDREIHHAARRHAATVRSVPVFELKYAATANLDFQTARIFMLYSHKTFFVKWEIQNA
jgi:hypothetical protein